MGVVPTEPHPVILQRAVCRLEASCVFLFLLSGRHCVTYRLPSRLPWPWLLCIIHLPTGPPPSAHKRCQGFRPPEPCPLPPFLSTTWFHQRHGTLMEPSSPTRPLFSSLGQMLSGDHWPMALMAMRFDVAKISAHFSSTSYLTTCSIWTPVNALSFWKRREGNNCMRDVLEWVRGPLGSTKRQRGKAVQS